MWRVQMRENDLLESKSIEIIYLCMKAAEIAEVLEGEVHLSLVRKFPPTIHGVWKACHAICSF